MWWRLPELHVQSAHRVQLACCLPVGSHAAARHDRVRGGRGCPRLHDLQVPPSRGWARAAPDHRQRRARNHLDRHSGADPRVPRGADGQDDLPDAAEGARQCRADRGDRAPVVVGVPLPAVRHRDRQRAVPADRTAGEFLAPHARRAALLLDSPDGRQARPDRQPRQLSLVYAEERHDVQRVQRHLRGILRFEPRQHALACIHGDARGIRQVGGAPEDAGDRLAGIDARR